MIVAELELDVTASGAQEAQDQLLQIQNVAQDVADTAINLDINTDDIKTELVDTLGGQEVTVKTVADTSDAVEEIRDLGEVSLEDLGIEVDADVEPARKALAELESEDVKVNADTAPAEKAIDGIERDLKSLSNAKAGISLDTTSLALAQRDVQKMVDGGQDLREAASEWSAAWVEAGRDSTDSLDDLEAYYRQVYQELSQGIDIDVDSTDVAQASTEIERFPDATQKAGSAAKESFKEMAGSFDGDVSQMGDAAQRFVSGSLMGFGPAGIAAGIAAAVGLGAIRGAFEDAAKEAQETAEGIADVSEGLIGLKEGESQTDLVVDNLKQMASSAQGAGTELSDLGDSAKNTGIDVNTYVRGMAGDTSALAQSYAEIEAAQEELERQNSALSSSTGTGSASIQAQISALEDQKDGLSKVAYEQQEGADSAELYAEVTADIGDASGDATDALKEQLGVMQDLQGITLDAHSAAINFQEALEGAAEAVAKNGAGLDITTEAGRANSAALDDIAKSGMDVVDSMRDQGAEAPELQARMASVRQAYLDAASAAGVGSSEASRMADELQLIPDEVKADVEVESNSSEATSRIKSDLADVPTEIPIMVRIKAAWEDFKTAISSQFSAAFGVPHHADGGPITGPGGPTDDDVIIAASAGEHMIPANEVQMAGGQSGVFALRSALRAGTLSYPGGPTTATTASASTAVVGPSALAGALDGVRMTLDVDGRQIDGVIRATARDEALDVARDGQW